jgi:hypothetical protein
VLILEKAVKLYSVLAISLSGYEDQHDASAEALGKEDLLAAFGVSFERLRRTRDHGHQAVYYPPR